MRLPGDEAGSAGERRPCPWMWPGALCRTGRRTTPRVRQETDLRRACAAAAGLVPLYARVGSAGALLVLGPLLALFGTRHFTGCGIITAGFFPTSLRAMVMGLTYNFERGLSAAAPLAIGFVATRRNLGSAFWLSFGAFPLTRFSP